MDEPTPRDLAHAAVSGDPEAVDAFLDALKRRHKRSDPHMGAHLGIDVLEIGRDRVVMRMPWRRELQRGGGIFHGGAIMALADHVAGAVFNTDPRNYASNTTGLTTDFNASFLRAAQPGEALVAEGRVLRRGKNVTFVQIEIRAEASAELVALCRTTYQAVSRDRVGHRKRER